LLYKQRRVPRYERCPVCRKVLDGINEDNHVKKYLDRHRLQFCRFCNRLISIDNMKEHVTTQHIETQYTKSVSKRGNEPYAVELPIPQKVPWKILPHDTQNFQAVLQYFEDINRRKKLGHLFEQQRLHGVYELGADEIYVGKDEFDGYVIFVFLAHGMAVLESPYYGNATYVIGVHGNSCRSLQKAISYRNTLAK
jgi:hypothetical protein